MKVLQILVLIFTTVISINAQIDCAVRNKVVVIDYDGNTIKDAKLEVYEVDKRFNKTFAFGAEKVENDAHYFISTLGSFRSPDGKFFSVSGNYRLRVTAEGFKAQEQSVTFERCKARDLMIVLEQISQKIKLTGVVFDLSGAVIVGAKLKVRNESGETFEAQTNDDGVYALKLLPGLYEIELEHPHFKKQTLKRFLLVNSTYGKINQDLVLEAAESSCLTATAAPC